MTKTPSIYNMDERQKLNLQNMKYYHSCATQFENLQNVHNLFLNDDKAR